MAGLLGQASPTPDFYQRLLDTVIDHTPLASGELEALADARAKAVIAELVEHQHFDARRITQGAAEPATPAGDTRVAIRLDLQLE